MGTQDLAFTKKTDEEVADAIVKAKGFISIATKLLGLSSPSSLRSRIKKNPELNQVLEDIRNENLDICESKLQEAYEAGKDWAIVFYLKTQGRDRGYQDRQDININANLGVVALENIFSVDELRSMNERYIQYSQSDNSPKSLGEG